MNNFEEKSIVGKDPGLFATAAILAFPLIGQAGTMLNPAMNVLQQHFQGYDVYQLSTFPGIFSFVGNLFAGAILGRKIKYRTMAILSSILFVISGLIPFMFSSYWVIFACMSMLGLSLGLFGPFANSLILGMYSEKKRVNLLGYVQMCGYAGGVGITMLGGILADFGWRYIFLGYLLGIVGLIAAFFLPEPDQKVNEKNEEQKKGGFIENVGKGFFAILIIMVLMNMINMPNMLQLSELIAERGFGGATVTATAISAFNLAACIGGLIFGRIFARLKRWFLSIGYFMSVAGMVLIYTAHVNFFQIVIGLCMISVAGACAFASMFEWVGRVVPKQYLTVSTAFTGAAGTIGSFLSAYYIRLLKTVAGESLYSAMIMMMIVYGIFGIIFVVYCPFKEGQN